MLTRHNLRSAFTLLELMIVVIIIGLIAGMAMPQFHKMIEEAKIREAKSILRAIRGAEKIFKAETTINGRSEERRVGKECRSRWSPYH